MYISASDTSNKMIMDLISSASHGICDYLGKITRTMLNVAKLRLQLFLLQESRRPPASAADNSQIMLGLQRGTSQHEHHL